MFDSLRHYFYDNYSHEQDVLWLLACLLRGFYLAAAVVILCVRLISPLRDRFLAYGARAVSGSASTAAASQNNHVTTFLDWAASLTVPHSWFYHFYVVSTLSTCFCAFAVRHVLYEILRGSTVEIRAGLALLVILIQDFRRLLECLYLIKPSQSRMWFGHYAIGIAFYLVTNLAIYLHICETSTDKSGSGFNFYSDITRTVLPLLVFARRSYQQHTVHRYLANLRGYQVPDHPLFARKRLIAPHYSAECDIYLALSFLAAPPNAWVNWTFMCAWIFVTINLGITADGTKQWLKAKFPEKRKEIEARHLMFSSEWYLLL